MAVNFAINPRQLAGQQSSLAGQQSSLAGQTPVDAMAQDALSNFASLNGNYQAPLRSTAQYAPQGGGMPDDRSLAFISALFTPMGQHAINQDGPNPTSPFFNQASDGRAQQIQQMPGWQRVAKGIWDNTMGGYIHTWQTNPEAAAVETLAGVGLIAATALAPELAPVIWTGAALLAAPTILPATVSSLADAWHSPNDQTISQALINVGTAAITIGSPVKAFRGVSTARSIAEAQAGMVQRVASPGELARNVMGVSEKAAQSGTLTDVRALVDPTGGVEQYHLVPQTLDELEQEIARRSGGQAPIDVSGEDVERLRQLMNVHGQMGRRIQRSTGDELTQAKGVNSVFEQDDLVPAMRDFSARYGYVLAKENRMPRMTADQVAQVPTGVKAAIDRRMRGILGIIHGSGEGHGWDGMSDGVIDSHLAGNLSEAMARGSAGGGLEHAGLEVERLFREAGRRAGVDESKLEDIYRAIEGDPDHADPEHHWGGLDPTHQYLAEWMHTAFGTMTNYAYKHGHIELPLQRYVPRIRERPPVERGEDVPARTSDEFLKRPGGVESRSWIADDWGRANEMTAEEFHSDPDTGLRPISDRLRQAVMTRGAFADRESGRQAAFQAAQPLRDFIRNPQLNTLLKQRRREYGQLTKDLLPNTQRKLDESTDRHQSLQGQVDRLNAQVAALDKQAGTVKGRHGQQPARAQVAQQRQVAIDNLRKQTRALDSLRKRREDWQAKLGDYQRRAQGFVDRFAQETGSEHAADLLKMGGDELRKLSTMPVSGRKLLSGAKLFEVQAGRFLRQMNQTRYREAWGSIAQTRNDALIGRAYGADRPMSVAEINALDGDQRPVAVTDDLPPGDPGRQMLEGYDRVMPELGQPGQVNYQPAIYARGDVAGKYKAWAQRARSASELHTAFARSVYGISVGLPKRLIMGSPAWHGKNVMGRYVTMLLDHPAVAGHAMFHVLKDRMTSPEKYYQTMMDYWMDGGVPANKHNVHEQVNFLEQQATGQRGFNWALRTAGLGPLGHGHAKLAEGWFWKTVNDVGAAAYLLQKQRMMARPGISEGVAGMMAAEYANNIAGMVNPLYMSKLWKQGRQMALFAPNWWTTFTRMAAQAVPGSARISEWLSKHPSMRALDPVKMHSLDIRQRKELVRMHRSYFLTYMAAGMTAHDLMNVVLSGHHSWENNKGHEWDIQVGDQWIPPAQRQAPGDPEVEAVKHAYMPGDPLFAQMADTMNVVGLGHDWGFFHQMTGDGFKQADARHKVGLLATALGTGLRTRGAGKVGMPVQEALGALGIDSYNLLRDGEVKHIPQVEALAGLLPAGFQAQVAMDDQRKLETRLRITGDPRSLQQLQALQSEGSVGGVPLKPVKGALLNQFTGLPSLYYTGDEAAQGYHFLSETETAKYLQSRQDILTRKRTLSEQLFGGQLSPYDWVSQDQIQKSRYVQLLSDTFGQSSTQGQMWVAYDALNKKYKLDDPNMSQQQKYDMLAQRDADWQSQLDSFSPQAKAVWWDAHTSMWTDADYLYEQTRQVKDSIASSIDGEGGAHIRQAQRALSSQGLPLTAKAVDEMRQQDPYLWAYYGVLKQLGRSSLLGAVTSAFHNPFAQFAVIPPEAAASVAALEQQGAISPSAAFTTPQTFQALGQQAVSQGRAAGPEGGNVAATPEGLAQGRGIAAQEAAAILADSTQTKNLSPQVLALLQKLAGGG
jgi:hypothetical protein